MSCQIFWDYKLIGSRINRKVGKFWSLLGWLVWYVIFGLAVYMVWYDPVSVFNSIKTYLCQLDELSLQCARQTKQTKQNKHDNCSKWSLEKGIFNKKRSCSALLPSHLRKCSKYGWLPIKKSFQIMPICKCYIKCYVMIEFSRNCKREG